MYTLMSERVLENPCPVMVMLVPAWPSVGDREEMEGVRAESNVKEQFLLVQEEGTPLIITSTCKMELIIL